MDPSSLWKRYQDLLVRYSQPEFSLDISRMNFEQSWLLEMEPRCQGAFDHMEALEAGGIANPDEDRMVGHYWLRNPELAPEEELTSLIQTRLAEAKAFGEEVRSGAVKAPNGKPFDRLLIIGIGGSALGPQLVTDALKPAMPTWFFDNTDPDGMDHTLAEIGEEGMATTLVVVISKSGGTPETRNGMEEAIAAWKGNFAAHAVAVTGDGSKLDKKAEADGWIRRFHMSDWVGGRTSIMSVVGLVPHAIQGVDLDQFLKGAADMDELTRLRETGSNASMLLALMWYHACKREEEQGRGRKSMVVLPYKDRLVLFSKYLQQLIMESVGKELDLDGNVVHEGIAVYGNKGSTDQHAYIQQLRDGTNNFFALFVEVLRGRAGDSPIVGDNATSGDFLQGFLRGTRAALTSNDRESITISIPEVNAYYLGALIGLFERAVTLYAALVNVNAYHQPGVEAGKKAAGVVLDLMTDIRSHLASSSGKASTADDVASSLNTNAEDVYHILNHLAANDESVSASKGITPAQDQFSFQS